MGVISASPQLYRYIGTEEGLSSRRVISVRKDAKGYMWFLTQEGVDRYNGKQYVHYKLSDEDKTIQNFPNLSHLHIDNTGGIWVIGKNGYAFKYNNHLDKYDLILNFADSLQTGQKLPVTHILMDRNDRLWLCTKNAQYIFHPQKNRITQLDSPIKEEVTFVRQGEDNQFFIGTGHNILEAQLEGNRLTVKSTPVLENFHIIQHLYYHKPTQSLLIGTLMDGFYLYKPDKKTLESIAEMKDVTMNCVIPAFNSQEEVLIATDGNGVYKLNMATKELESYISASHDYSNKMNGDIIKDIYQDEENRIWMAVFPIGITVCSQNWPKHEWLQNTDEGTNLASNQITYLLEDSDGDLWASTSNGVYMYNTQTKKWRSMLTSFHQNKHDQNHVFISLCEAEPGVIYVGGYMSGMYRINKKDFIPHYFTPQSLGYRQVRPDKYIRSIYRDEEGKVWAGGYYNFKSLNPQTNEMEHYPINFPITYITSKNANELWIGTINGLYKFNKREKKLLQVNLSSDIGTINTIYQAGENTTYIGTNGSGMWVYDNQTEKLENFDIRNSSLISNNIFCILPSNKEGELIISTDNELTCFNIQERIFLNWAKEQGLLNGNFNTASGVKTRDGSVLFGSDNGLIMITDTIALPRIFKSKLVFDNFNIQYQLMKPGMENSPLTMPIDETKSITLPHDQNIFSLEVSSINYDCPSRILYSWKMEGFYDEWTKPSNIRLIRYTGLPPGKYKLKVRAILLDDNHIMEERDIQIIIKPPLSQTTIAYIFYVCIFLLIVLATIRHFWLSKTSLISKEKIQFFINTAHNIRTPLTLIKGPLDEISRTETLSEKGQHNLLTAIQSTDKLSELATKLIDFEKEEMYTSHVQVNSYELNQYIQEFLKGFKDYADNKHIQLTYEGSAESLEAWIDTNKIESILHNLVSNALKYTPEEGIVTVKLSRNSSHWSLIISDTGIGISEADQKKMFKHLFRGENAINQRITGTGIGMLQTYRLVKRHHGSITVSSKENEGTTFTLQIPINHAKYLRQATKPNKKSTVLYTDTTVINVPKKPTTSLALSTAPNILIVEDNPELRNFLSLNLSDTYVITTSENGEEALELLNNKQPDLIISDIMMPVMRGDELCKKLKSDVETSHIPIILLTALGDRENIIRGLKIKADSYVVKPFDMDILKATITSILANKETLRQRFAQLNYRTEDLPTVVQETPGLELDQAFLKKATSLIKENLSKDFNVDDLCTEIGMSRSSFYNKIKALTNCSPSEFIRQIRMKEAANLLKSQKYTIAEVSDLTGYGDPKYFTDVFKKHYGMSPSAYMKQEKK